MSHFKDQPHFRRIRMKFIEVYKEKGFMSAVKTPGVQKAIEEAKVKDNLFYRILGKIKRRFR